MQQHAFKMILKDSSSSLWYVLSMMLNVCAVLLVISTVILSERVDYTGHKVLSVTPETKGDVEFLLKLCSDDGIDLWNEPKVLGSAVMVQLSPNLIKYVEEALTKNNIKFETAFEDLQSVILAERVMNLPINASNTQLYDFGMYQRYESVVALLNRLSIRYPTVASLKIIGLTYEKRPIHNLVIGKSSRKKAIMIECGIHAREWSSVSVCAYFVNTLVTGYGNDPLVTSLVDKYELNVVVISNPDGYVYTWNVDRMWRKTRSRSDLLGRCRGVDGNRNWDIEHCIRKNSSRNPCDDYYCGDSPFSESETRALRDLLIILKDRLKGYFTVHAYSQLWMTPYAFTKSLPPDYNELMRIATVGTQALEKKYGTQYQVGAIANILYEASGSSMDYVYVKLGIKMAFTLEIRDTGEYGFFLPRNQILPMCEETYDGLVAAILAL